MVPGRGQTQAMAHHGLSRVGNCHRVALAIEDFDGAMRLWRDVFGLGAMMPSVTDDLDKSQMGIVWAGNVPLLALSSTDPDGTVGRYLTRNGPGVQSLAWEIEDMWGTDHRLRRAGIRITGVHIEGRHFFMHPKDTSGLLLEFTDDRLPLDPRLGGGGPDPVTGLIPVESIAWVTAVVADLDSVVEQFDLIFGEPVEPASGAVSEHERAVEVQLGDLLVRLVEPLSDESRYAGQAQGGMGRLHSVSLAVAAFDRIEAGLAAAGLGVVHRDEGSVWLDPAGTQGVRFELIDADTVRA